MRREICGECDTPINDEGSCDCTELLKRGWRKCAVGQKTTQWCQMAEDVRRELREQKQHDEALLRQALEALEFFRDTAICSVDTDVATEAIVALRERLVEEHAEQHSDDAAVDRFAAAIRAMKEQA